MAMMTVAWKSPSLILALAVGLGACQDSQSSDPSQQVGQLSSVVTLRYGESTFVENIEIRFGAVQDSRCPSQVECFAAGNAQVVLGVGPPRGTEGPTDQVLLNSTYGSRSGEAWGLRVTLLEVSPYPVYAEPIPPEQYVVQLKVERSS